ncbi:hypothetical protein TM1040_1373 [Ruegeria sp. TM1040]|uniref:DUF6477 family protein n=1 Tax=Ruegeria sp. (strain TM1040) TaxID=292414 RepID=UPI000046247D|nr:DUF6477 family protein [Ruegeria sp. TM1040]ABF64106.1 hypothetical protein TM1040_1373 [Ruegeria sp. TM1040]
MQDLRTRLTTLHRPRLLARTARIGADDYIRQRDLKRLLPSTPSQGTGAILMQLLDLEATQERARLGQNPGYSFARHVAVLTALSAESRLYLASRSQPRRATKNGAPQDAV